MDFFGANFAHAQACDIVPVQRATQWTASVHSLHMPRSEIITLVFKVLRNGVPRYILHTCSCKPACHHVPVRSATKWNAWNTLYIQTCDTFLFKGLRNGLLRYTLYTCPCKPVITFLFKVLCKGLLRHSLYACVKTCENVSVQTAMPWTAAVHFLHMPKPVQKFLFKVLINGFLPHIHAHANLW